MGMIHINNLESGMMLADEVRDLSGRLLLGKGKTVQRDHFRIFKTWGITEVNICGNNGNKEDAKNNLDIEQIEKIKDSTLKVFIHNDLNHPAIKEIYQLSVWFRSENNYSGADSNMPVHQDDLAENIDKKNWAEKLNMADITLPEAPSIVFELNDVIASPQSTADDIAQVVQKSPSLTARLLKIVNSTCYSIPSKIDKISSAVILLGTKEIASLALGISILTTFDKIPKNKVDMFSFLKHSFICGMISRMLATHKGIPQTEQFFVSGLLHDLGRLIIYEHFPEDSHNILQRSQTTNNLLYEIERDYFGCDHSHVAKHLIQQWSLPISLENNILYHHNPSEAPQQVAATIIHLADIITHGLGIGTSGERFVPPLDTKAWIGLKLSPTCFDIVVKRAIHQFVALEPLLEN